MSALAIDMQRELTARFSEWCPTTSGEAEPEEAAAAMICAEVAERRYPMLFVALGACSALVSAGEETGVIDVNQWIGVRNIVAEAMASIR